ncbi:Speriolin, partial [Ophiophagus hannah]
MELKGKQNRGSQAPFPRVSHPGLCPLDLAWLAQLSRAQTPSGSPTVSSSMALAQCSPQLALVPFSQPGRGHPEPASLPAPIGDPCPALEHRNRLSRGEPAPPALLTAGSPRIPLSPIADQALGGEANKQERIVGEVAFQLDRRILSSIFPDRLRLYGFTVRNIPEKISQREKDPFLQLSPEQSEAIMERYNSIMDSLKLLGYDPRVHPSLTERMVNTFGILRERPKTSSPEAAAYGNLQHLEEVVKSVVPAEMLEDCLLLLNCLQKLSQEDGKPLFIW